MNPRNIVPPIPPNSKTSRRAMLLSGAAFMLTGCTQSPVLANAAKALKFAFVGLPDATFDRALVSKIPYASLSAKIGKGPRSLLILNRYSHDDRHWISADRAILVTRHGRVVKTAGFPENLLGTSNSQHDPVNRKLHKLKAPVQFSRTIDLDLDNNFGIPITSVFKPLGLRKIEIADLEINTYLVQESNVARIKNWSFNNYYWVDAFDGFVWKSRQHVARSFDPLDIEILKPPA